MSKSSIDRCHAHYLQSFFSIFLFFTKDDQPVLMDAQRGRRQHCQVPRTPGQSAQRHCPSAPQPYWIQYEKGQKGLMTGQFSYFKFH